MKQFYSIYIDRRTVNFFIFFLIGNILLITACKKDDENACEYVKRGSPDRFYCEHVESSTDCIMGDERKFFSEKSCRDLGYNSKSKISQVFSDPVEYFHHSDGTNYPGDKGHFAGSGSGSGSGSGGNQGTINCNNAWTCGDAPQSASLCMQACAERQAGRPENADIVCNNLRGMNANMSCCTACP